MTPKPINFAARFTMLARLLSGPATAAELAAAADLEQGHTSNILAAWERRGAVRATFETSGSGVRRMALRWQINVPQTGVCGTSRFEPSRNTVPQSMDVGAHGKSKN